MSPLKSLAARVTSEDLLAAILSDRSLSSGQDIEARGLFSNLFEVGIDLLNNFQHDAPPGELAGRDAIDDFLSTLSNRATCKSSPGAPETVAWDDNTKNAFIDTLLNSRDSLMGELSGRDAVDDFGSYMSSYNTRELIPEQETQDSSIPDDAPKPVAQDSSAAGTFIDAPLKTRDSGSGITPSDMLALHLLGGITCPPLSHLQRRPSHLLERDAAAPYYVWPRGLGSLYLS